MKNRPVISRRRFLGEASCAAVSSLPILSTLLNLRLSEGIARADAPTPGEYRALVCILLGGGNDSFNMLAPGSIGLRDSFADIGASLAEWFGLPPLGHGRSFLHSRSG